MFREIACLVAPTKLDDVLKYNLCVYEQINEEQSSSDVYAILYIVNDSVYSLSSHPYDKFRQRITIDGNSNTSDSGYSPAAFFPPDSKVRFFESETYTILHEQDGSKNIKVEYDVDMYNRDDDTIEHIIENVSGLIELTFIGARTDDFTDTDKQALQNNTVAIKAKLIVKATDTEEEIVLTEDNSIKSLTYNDDRYVPNQGWVGQFVARTLEGELQNITTDFNIENRIVNFQLGVVRMNDDVETWYSFGDFMITKPEENEVIDNTKFTAMDYTKKFNQVFDGDFTNANFPESLNTKVISGETYTPYWLARYTCEQVGVPFMNSTFTNDSFELTINPFQNNETCRDVMKEIAKLAFSWVRIDWNNRCYIDFIKGDTNDIDKYHKVDNNQYFTLETQNNKYGPINKVVFGMSGVDGESVYVDDKDSIAIHGEHPIYIYDNPLLPTYDMRSAAVQKGNVLFGLSYIPLKTETIGHPWFRGNKLITIYDMNGNSKITYPFNRQLKYTGHIRSVIESTGETEVEATYAYDNRLLKDLRNAMIKVDKQEGIITEHTSRLEVVEDEFDNYYTIEKTNELINDAKSGLTNTYTTSGGNNILKNTGLYFEEGNTFEYWDGIIGVRRNVDSASGTSMLLQNNHVTQTVNDLPNGEYTISFGYSKLNELATGGVVINNIVYDLENQGKFEQSIVVDNNTIIIDFVCDTNDGYEIWELMCNKGNVSSPWTQHANEVRTDMVSISKGIRIESSAINSTFKADADGIRIENETEDKTTEFTDDGMETDVAVVRRQGQITGALFNKVGNQTWINGL